MLPFHFNYIDNSSDEDLSDEVSQEVEVGSYVDIREAKYFIILTHPNFFINSLL